MIVPGADRGSVLFATPLVKCEVSAGLSILAITRSRSGMSQYFQEYVTVGAFAAVGILGVASVIRPSNPTAAKKLAYECGVDPVGSGWSQTYIRYYIFGLLFVVFDVEAVFIFPWAIRAEELGIGGVIAIVLFMLTLIEGLVYAIKKGVLAWE